MGCEHSNLRETDQSKHQRAAPSRGNSNINSGNANSAPSQGLQPSALVATAPPASQSKRPAVVPQLQPQAQAQPQPPSTSAAAASPAGQSKQSVQRPQQHRIVALPPVGVFPALPSVPPTSWYAAPFTENADTEISDFHYGHKGRVVLSKRMVALTDEQLTQEPSTEDPDGCKSFEVGPDLIYGVGFLHNTALFIEHQWRSRVVHLENVKAGRAQIPESVTVLQERLQARAKLESSGTAEVTAAVGMPLLRSEQTMYEHPFFDMFLGIKVFIDGTLVPDHYPQARSLPQCTTTIDAVGAVNKWLCVPFVLMGFLNHFTLDTIAIYRTLSLNFVEHLLHLKAPQRLEVGGGAATAKALHSSTPLKLRVEVVYGCRSEAYFCTDFISQGTCTLRMTERSKPALKSYEEKLRALIRASRSVEQVVHVKPRGNAAPRGCPYCGNRLLFRCTVCGAELCGSLACEDRSFPGYPFGCTAHKAQLS